MQLGIDLGSRTVKSVLLRDGRLVHHSVAASGFEPHMQAGEVAAAHPDAAVVATGYGRHLMRQLAGLEVITEIKAHALGARHFFPRCRTILDVGGQDSKVIQLHEDGRVAQFQMNDKCAAGTGRFLEMMALVLGYDLEEFGKVAAEAEGEAAINSMCAVFAESEVISLKNRGIPPADIARSLHIAVAGRLAGMVAKAGSGKDIVFTGGVANNRTMVTLLGRAAGVPVLVPENPTIVGALGAALHAAG